jgi:hypothetical protein
MDVEAIASALKEALERDGEVDPDEMLGTIARVEGRTEFSDLLEVEGVESRSLASFSWDGGGAPISSFLAIRAVRLGSDWFVFCESDDFQTMVLDQVQVIDRESATGTVERICRAHEYVSSWLPDVIELDDLVDRARIVRCFDED